MRLFSPELSIFRLDGLFGELEIVKLPRWFGKISIKYNKSWKLASPSVGKSKFKFKLCDVFCMLCATFPLPIKVILFIKS